MCPKIGIDWFCRALFALVVAIYLGVWVDIVTAQDTPQVIILNSYHRGFAWSDAEEAGFIERFGEVYPAIDVPIEYLDAKHYPDQDNLARMKDFLLGKYQGKRIDLVVALDNPALDMLIRYQNELFPDSPVVFAGVSNFNSSMLAGRQRVTGVAEKQNLWDTLQVALTLHPQTEEILVIDDYTSSGLTSRQEMEALMPSLDGQVRIRFLPPVTFDEARAEISSLSPGQLVLINSFSTDRLGRNLSLAESTRFLTGDARVPVYAGHETRLGHGIIGGYLLDGRDHGKQAADMGLRILAGGDPTTIPVNTNGTARPMFDYVQLERFGVSVTDLPADSIIINRPESIFDKYRAVVIGTLSVMTVLAVLVMFLITSIIRRRQAEKTLEESEERLRLALEGTTDGIWDWDLKTGQVYFNPRYYTMLGYEPDEFIGTYENWRRLLHPDDALATEEVLQQALKNQTPYATEFRVRTKNGDWCWILGRGKVVELDQAGQARRMAGSHTDITKRKRAEAALQENEQKFRTVVQNAQAIIFIMDREGKFLLSEGQALAKLGLVPGQVVGLSALELYKDNLSVLTGIRKALAGELTHITNVVQDVVFDVVYSPYYNLEGALIGVVGIAIDITEHKQAEAALRQKTEELDQFFTVALDLLCIADTEGYFRRLNPQWEVVLGYSVPELEGQRFIDLVHPDDQASTLAAISDLSAQKLVLNFVNRYRCKDGSYRWIEWRSYPAGNLVYAAARDITEHKRAEAKLRTSEVRYRALVQSQIDLISRYLPDTTLTFANDAYCKFYGKTPEELIGQSYLIMVAPEFHQQALKETENFVKDPRPISGEYLNYRWDGQECWIHWILQGIVDDDGRLVEIQATGRDITPLKRAEEEIRKLNQELEQRVAERTAQLEAANRELEAFSYSVSHDLRAPLRAVDGYTRILEEDYQAVLDAEGQRVCAVIRQQTQRMGKLIDDLLAFSRLGRAQMEAVPIDMAALATSVFQELTTPEDQARIDFHLGPLPPALGDPTMIRQVWLNLLANAIKFSARRERAIIEVSGCQAGGENIYSVRDNGAGFDMQYAAKLFGVFQRLHSEREFEGTGVGLALIQRIIHRHDGRVWAESVVDQGAVFYFTLPQKGD